MLSRSKRTGREVAVKVIRCSTLSEANSAINEAFQLHNHHHANMVDCATLFLELDGASLSVCMEMPFFPRGDLLGLIQRAAAEPPPFWPRWVRAFGLQMADALRLLHSLGFVHRDLKPQNVLVDDPSPTELPPPGGPDAIPPVLKITDFGLLRKMEEMSLRTVCGTPAYMAPEQVLSRYGIEADVWALGCILVHLLTFDFPPKSPMNMVAAQIGFTDRLRSHILSGGAVPPASVPPDAAARRRFRWPAWLADLTLSLLALDPAARPTAASIVETLRAHPELDDLPPVLVASPPVPPPSVWIPGALSRVAAPEPLTQTPTAGGPLSPGPLSLGDACTPLFTPSSVAIRSTTSSTALGPAGRVGSAGGDDDPAGPAPAEMTLEARCNEVLRRYRMAVPPDRVAIGVTALMQAAAKGVVEAVREMLPAGLDPAVAAEYVARQDTAGRTALMWAADSSAPRADKCVQLIADIYPAALRMSDSKGHTPLHAAVTRTEHPRPDCTRRKVVARLLERGADPNSGEYTRRTALHIAARNGCDQCVAELLAGGASPALQDKRGQTAEELARTHGKVELADFLRTAAAGAVAAGPTSASTPYTPGRPSPATAES